MGVRIGVWALGVKIDEREKAGEGVCSVFNVKKKKLPNAVGALGARADEMAGLSHVKTCVQEGADVLRKCAQEGWMRPGGVSKKSGYVQEVCPRRVGVYRNLVVRGYHGGPVGRARGRDDRVVVRECQRERAPVLGLSHSHTHALTHSHRHTGLIFEEWGAYARAELLKTVTFSPRPTPGEPCAKPATTRL